MKLDKENYTVPEPESKVLQKMYEETIKKLFLSAYPPYQATNAGTFFGDGSKAGPCRLCGKQEGSLSQDGLCKEKCQSLLEIEKIKSLMHELIPQDSKEHCFKCLSHINACVCPPNKQLEKLGN